MYERYFILSQRKLHNSKAGNPRWKFVAVDRYGETVTLTTKADAGWVYRITDGWRHRMITAITHNTTRNTIMDAADLAEVF